MSSFISGRWLQALVALLCAAVLLRALVPVGYMLAPSTGTKGPQIVICSHDGTLFVAGDEFQLPAADEEPKGGDRSHDASPCIWAVSSHLASAPASIESIAAPIIPLGRCFVRIVAADPRPKADCCPPTPPRGPPVNA